MIIPPIDYFDTTTEVVSEVMLVNKRLRNKFTVIYLADSTNENLVNKLAPTY